MLASACGDPCEAAPRLANVFSDHLVLQRDMPVPVWGTAKPGELVTLTFAGQRLNALADNDGRWLVTLTPLAASSEGRVLSIFAADDPSKPSSSLTDVLVGDVWLCAGPGGVFQRETERLFKIAAAETAKAQHPQLRLLRPVLSTSLIPVDDIDPADPWTVVTPKTIGSFPISWYFGRELNTAEGVPVGLIQVHSGTERPSEWRAWRPDPKNGRQMQALEALTQALPRDIASIEAWLEDAKTWKPGLPFRKNFPLPAYLRTDPEPRSPLLGLPHSAFNFNVAPFTGMSLRGVLFLCEFDRCTVNRNDLAELIGSWRQAWGSPELPFLLMSQLQRTAQSARVDEALAAAASLPQVRVLPPPAETAGTATNEALWRSAAAVAEALPIPAHATVQALRKWTNVVSTRSADREQRLEAACVFGENMVLQAGMRVPVWGWGEPGAEVSVSFAAQSVRGVVGEDGTWRVELAPLQTNRTPAIMTITSKGRAAVETLTFGNALVGEVWGNSGQSNAGRVMGATLGFPDEQPKADWPEIRYLRVAVEGSGFPLKATRGKWVVVRPDTVTDMPGQGYYFAKQLHQKLGTPVGILNASAGGSTIYAWTTEAALSTSPNLHPLLADLTRYREARTANLPLLQTLLQRWLDGARQNATVARPMPYYPVNALLSTAMEARGGVLYNAMIHPILGTALRGFLWNQGEADTGAGLRSEVYDALMRTTVADWRKSWGFEFPFYFVQMPARKTGGLTLMWEKQTLAMHSIPHSGMIVCNDIADGDVHPADKKNVGERLARLALVRTYGVSDLLDSSPFMKSAVRKAGGVLVTFAPVGDGLKTRDGKSPDCWELAGADGRFVPARAEIRGDQVVLFANGVPEPDAVRLGWREDSNCNLVNSAGLPAMPFSARVALE